MSISRSYGREITAYIGVVCLPERKTCSSLQCVLYPLPPLLRSLELRFELLLDRELDPRVESCPPVDDGLVCLWGEVITFYDAAEKEALTIR